jgi:pimeloyl-ACP methyl ester carboxylesterase
MLTLALLGFAAAAASATPVPPSSWTEGYVQTNGIRIHYWRTGGEGKTPLVMAHGSSDDALCWTHLAKELTGRYDIILYDARGHGLSDPPKTGDAADVQVDDMAGLIRELKLVKPIVMGHSMGAAATAWFAAKYPDAARAIILEDPGLVRRPGAPPPGFGGTPEERRAATLKRNNTSLEELIAGCMKGSPKWGRAECEAWAPSKRRHHPDTALVNIANRPPMKDLFAKITVPVLILKADAEGDLRKENEAIAATLAKGKIVHIQGAGHNVRRENKTQTLEVLNAFLRSLD